LTSYKLTFVAVLHGAYFAYSWHRTRAGLPIHCVSGHGRVLQYSLIYSSSTRVTNYSVSAALTDRRTDTARLRTASRGKSDSHLLKWKRFKCILVTVMVSDDQQWHCAA